MLEQTMQFSPGDHVALYYRNRAEQFSIAIPYIHQGLLRNEHCLYIVADNTIKSVLDALTADGVDVDEEQKRGALTIATPADTYLKHGVFEPQRMIDDLIVEMERTLARGFSAFRATGELSWALNLPSALARVHEYEASLDIRFPAQFLGLCQYNEKAFSPQILSQMLRVHPKVIARGQLLDNPYYREAGQSLNTELPHVTIDGLMNLVAA